MNHFNLEIIIDDYIDCFDKDKMQIEFVELHLYNPDDDKRVIIKNRRYNVLYSSLKDTISFNLFILNNSKDNSERIDFLIDEGFEVEDVIIDIYYDGEYIEDYSFNPLIGEQIDLIKFLLEKNIFDISINPYISINSVNQDLEILLMPINDDNYPVKRKLISKDSEMKHGFIFNEDGMSFSINNNNLLDSFEKIEVIISSKNSIIAPRDLDYFAINIGNQLNINFSHSEDKSNKKQISIDSFGNVNINYLTYYFKLLDIRTISLGYLTKKNNSIYFNFKIGYYSQSKLDVLSKINDIY